MCHFNLASHPLFLTSCPLRYLCASRRHIVIELLCHPDRQAPEDVGKSDGFQKSNRRGWLTSVAKRHGGSLQAGHTEWWRTVSVRAASSEIFRSLCKSVLILTCFAYSLREIICQICISCVQPTQEPWLLEIIGVTNEPRQNRGIGGRDGIRVCRLCCETEHNVWTSCSSKRSLR